MIAPLLALGVLGVAGALGYSLSRGRTTATSQEDGRSRSFLSDAGSASSPSSNSSSPSAASAQPSSGRGRASGWVTSTIRDINAKMSGKPLNLGGVAQWAPLLAPGCLRYGIQLAYALKWVDIESGGNPCEVGYPPAHGSGGPWSKQPREMGIVQFYNPDDLQALGLSGDALRAYCVPGDQHETMYKGNIVRGFSQKATRPLTSDEMAQQADGAVGLIKRSMSSATSDLMSVRAGPTWSPSTRNYWALVKLQHGLPQISRVGLPAVTKRLGRPPSGWGEFRTTLASVKLDDATEKKYRKDFDRVLDNAEACASVITEEAVV
jgi:hypothetical protein